MCLLLFSYPFFLSLKVSGIMSITGVLKTGMIAQCQVILLKPSIGWVLILYLVPGILVHVPD
jgi:hypothetical protein